MDKDSIIFAILISLIIFGIFRYLIWSYKDDKKLEKFKSQMVPGTKIRCQIAKLDDPEDISIFNATIIERYTQRQVIMKWGDGSKTKEFIEKLYRDGWNII